MNDQAARKALRDDRTRFVARVFLGLSLSILLHVIFSVATYEFSRYFEESAKSRQTMLLDWVEPSELKKDEWSAPKNQVVRKSQVPADLLDLNVKPKRVFLSEDKQTVKEEMRAAASGLTENRFDDGASLPKPPTSPSRASAPSAASAPNAAKTLGGRERLPEVVPNSIFVEGLGDVEVEVKDEARGGSRRTVQDARNTQVNARANESRELILPSDPRRNRGISTTGEELPKDIQIGDFTALNTDRFTFYSFYARVEEQIRHRWVRYVKAAIFGGGDIPEGARDFVTHLEIVLDREGNFTRAIVHNASGSRDIDSAAILAFREARKIPHPPREMVKDDGTIRLLYAFHVDQLPPGVARAKAPAPGDDRGDDRKTQ